jgi:hypothetical protein
VHEAIFSDRDGDMRGAGAFRREKEQVAGLDVFRLHLLAHLVLILDDAGYQDAVLREHVPHQAAAIEAGRIVAAQPIGHTAKAERVFGHCAAIVPSRKRREGCVRCVGCEGCGGGVRGGAVRR